MDTRRNAISLCIIGLLILAFPATILADEPADNTRESQVIIIGDDGDEMVIELDAIHEVVAEAMAEVEAVMAEMEDMQFQMRLGQDNRLDLSYDDKTFELDLDQIMTQVAAAVQVGFGECDTGAWGHQHDRREALSEDDLRRELDSLRDEMESLRKELRKLGSADQD